MARGPGIGGSMGLLILRLGFGALMLTHGWAKVEMLQAGKGGEFLDPFGIGGEAALGLAAAAEFGCVILVMLGLATRLAAVPVVVAMAVAAFVAHATDPWLMAEGAKLFQSGAAKSWSSKEPALLYLIPFLALIFTGPGWISIDGVIRAAWRRRHVEQPDLSEG